MKDHQLIVLLLFFSLPTFLFSQMTIRGKVLDAQSGDPIPFVNMGIKRLATGSVSDEAGFYQLFLENARPDDLVTISSIGYQSRELSLSALKSAPDIELQPQAYTIPNIELSAKKLDGKIITIGNSKRKRILSVGFANSQLGTEIGALLPIEKETWIKSAHFVVNRGSQDSLLFRLNIFRYENGRLGENLVRENILVPAPSRKGLMSVDLEKYNLVTDQPILLSLQWIRAYENDGKLLITFNAQKSGARDNLFIKASSVSDFQKTSQSFPGAPKYEACFYITGQQVKK
jgi:hypothetical protein